MSRLLEKTADGLALIGGVILISIVLVTTLNAGAFILDRIAGAFGANVSGLPGYEEFVRLSISCAALMFLPYCQLKRGHVAVDLFVKGLPRRVQILLNQLWLAVTVGIAVYLTIWMVRGMIEKHEDGVITGVLGWVEWPFYGPGILSLILWALVALIQIPQESRNG